MRNVVASCVRKSFTDDQLQIAYLLKECVMVRDGLTKLPDCFTVGDMSDIASCVHVHFLSLSLSLCLSPSLFLYICTPCTTSIINK